MGEIRSAQLKHYNPNRDLNQIFTDRRTQDGDIFSWQCSFAFGHLHYPKPINRPCLLVMLVDAKELKSVQNLVCVDIDHSARQAPKGNDLGNFQFIFYK
ncbi:hypothetical protein GIB67_005026 [Kingdonia uniflora]|uniref:Uncharacterized protein n=1 Tax=Kingdonia uniflora TaxID=39325 RepID=A0A7J7NNB3_9MAGN|nr:hypothetical protein GIB67_005026 [Kingdonia uniflora]